MAQPEALRIDPDGMPVVPTMAQAVVVNGLIFLSGVVPADDDGKLIGKDDPSAQAHACLDRIERVLRSAGAQLEDIIRLTCFATSADAARGYISARASRIKNRPAATTIMISELLIPDALMEIEVIARAPSGADRPS